MQWFSAAITAIGVTGICYGAQYYLNKKYEMNLFCMGKWIIDRVVLAVGIFACITTFLLGIVRLPQMGFTGYLLTAILLTGLAVITVTDWKKQLISNKTILLLLALWVVITGSNIIVNLDSGVALLFRSLGGALISGIIFGLCYLLSRGGMGAGDVKLAFTMGLYLTGERIMGAIFYGTILCCIFSVVQLFRKKLTLKNGVPMAPFLYAGTVLTLFIL